MHDYICNFVETVEILFVTVTQSYEENQFQMNGPKCSAISTGIFTFHCYHYKGLWHSINTEPSYQIAVIYTHSSALVYIQSFY